MRAGCIFYSDKINWKEFIVNSRELKFFWRYFEFYTRFLLLSMSKIWGIIRKEWFVWTFNIWPTCCITKFFPLHLKKCHLAKVQIYKLSSQGFFPLDLEGRVVHLEGRMPDPANSSPLPFLSPSQSIFVTSYQSFFSTLLLLLCKISWYLWLLLEDTKNGQDLNRRWTCCYVTCEFFWPFSDTVTSPQGLLT